MAVALLLAAAAVPTSAAATTGFTCDGIGYDAADPAHLLYGFRNDGIDVASGRLVVDVSGAPFGMVLFHDGVFPSYRTTITLPPGVEVEVTEETAGAVIVGSPHDDVICATTGDDIVTGGAGNDRIFGFGSLTDYDPVTGDGGDRLFGNRGDDVIVNGRSLGALSDRSALIAGRRCRHGGRRRGARCRRPLLRRQPAHGGRRRSRFCARPLRGGHQPLRLIGAGSLRNRGAPPWDREG